MHGRGQHTGYEQHVSTASCCRLQKLKHVDNGHIARCNQYVKRTHTWQLSLRNWVWAATWTAALVKTEELFNEMHGIKVTERWQQFLYHIVSNNIKLQQRYNIFCKVKPRHHETNSNVVHMKLLKWKCVSVSTVSACAVWTLTSFLSSITILALRRNYYNCVKIGIIFSWWLTGKGHHASVHWTAICCCEYNIHSVTQYFSL